MIATLGLESRSGKMPKSPFWVRSGCTYDRAARSAVGRKADMICWKADVPGCFQTETLPTGRLRASGGPVRRVVVGKRSLFWCGHLAGDWAQV